MAARLPGIGSHQSAIRRSDDWLTPQHILDALGPFYFDPCASLAAPNRCATYSCTQEHDGLSQSWRGMVWLNPPYSDVAPWMQRLAEHGDGIALVFARTETEWWQRHVWPRAASVLFLAGRLSFIRSDTMEPAAHNSGGPSALIAYGWDANLRLRRSGLTGALVGRAEMLPLNTPTSTARVEDDS